MEGYDAKFDPPLEKRLECPICLLAQREPVQTPCGHRFCFSCILRALRETGPKCPVDNIKISQSQLFKDNFAKREVLSLSVKCSAEEDGCKWNGELRDFESHTKHCDIISVECPYGCLSSFQRKYLADHLIVCSNKPCQCSYCSVCFPRDKTTEHEPFCSHIMIPDCLMKEICKNNEVAKWCGQLRLKLNGQSIQIGGYLTAKVESEESFVYTGKWFTALNVMPLTATSAKVFWKTLHHHEVQPYFFNFFLLQSDTKSQAFLRMLRKKSDATNAVVGLRLKSSSHRYLTIIYFYWNDQKKCISVCVAELESYLVKQIQNRLQVLQQSSRGHDSSGMPMREGGHSLRLVPQPQHHVVDVMRGNIPAEPAIRIMGIQPQPNSNGPAIVSNILSWQISQSFPTFPWRMHAANTGVPFFTIPATPPQFLPAHSYPYTFAPMPGAPFSISPLSNPIAVPSYTTIPVPPSQIAPMDAAMTFTAAPTPSATTLEGNRVPLHSNPNTLIGIIQQQLQPTLEGNDHGTSRDHLVESVGGIALHPSLDRSQYVAERSATLHRFVPDGTAYHTPEPLRLRAIPREGAHLSHSHNNNPSTSNGLSDSMEPWGGSSNIVQNESDRYFRPPSDSDMSHNSSPVHSVSAGSIAEDSAPESPVMNLDMSGSSAVSTDASDHLNLSALQTLANAAAILSDANESSFDTSVLASNPNQLQIPLLVRAADSDLRSPLSAPMMEHGSTAYLVPSNADDGTQDVLLIPVIHQIGNAETMQGYSEVHHSNEPSLTIQHIAAPFGRQELQHASGLVLNTDPSILATPATTRAIPVVHWPMDNISGPPGRLYGTNASLAHQQGNFWDTVMPSLDANLQSSSHSHSQTIRRH